jgi:endonuclease YncB( thermonuclease family)
MRKPAAAIALAALVLVVPLPTGAAGARAHAPAGMVAVRPHVQPQARPHALHGGAHQQRYPYANLMPGLVVHHGHKPEHPTHPIAGMPPHHHHHHPPVRRVLFVGPAVVVSAPIGYAYMPYWAQELAAPAIAIDGDTFDSGGVRYRLYGIDTPELGEPLGARARERLQQLLAMAPVSVIPVTVDVYGRQVADVIVAGLNVAGVLRAEGFAKP